MKDYMELLLRSREALGLWKPAEEETGDSAPQEKESQALEQAGQALLRQVLEQLTEAERQQEAQKAEVETEREDAAPRDITKESWTTEGRSWSFLKEETVPGETPDRASAISERFERDARRYPGAFERY